MNSIQEILQIDANCRVPGIAGDLHKLETLQVNKDWTYDAPTLVKAHSNYLSQTYINNLNDFKNRFYNKYRILFNIDLTNLFVAGGAIRSTLLNQSTKDLDIFVYGLNSPNDATIRIETFLKDIHERMLCIQKGVYLEMELEKLEKPQNLQDKHQVDKYNNQVNALKLNRNLYDSYMNLDIHVTYNGHTITVQVDNITMQIILRLYKTKSEIIHGFDLGSSAVGFDGHNVWFTTLSKYCYEHMVNIFDGTRRSTTYEYRLIKYFENGFNIILPNLNIQKLRTNYLRYNLCEVCELPYMVFSYEGVNGNSIQVNKFYNIKNAEEVTSDYDFYDNDDSNTYKIPYFNLTELISGKCRFIYILDLTSRFKKLDQDNNNEDKEDDKDDKDDIDTGNSLLVFNECVLRYGFVEWMYSQLLDKMNNNIINMNNVNKYFNIMDPKKVIQDVYLSNLNAGQREILLKDIIQKQKEWIKGQLDKINKEMKINWMTENPTTQLTSSFNPIIEDPKLWYGELYKN